MNQHNSTVLKLERKLNKQLEAIDKRKCIEIHKAEFRAESLRDKKIKAFEKAVARIKG